MHITSVTRLRLDTIYGTTDWNNQEQMNAQQKLINDLTFDVDYTGCHVPPIQRSDVSSDQLKYYQDDYLVFPHYISFMQMLSKLYIYICY